MTHPAPPVLIGYEPEEAERAAAAAGYVVVWVEAASPQWLALSPRRNPRVGRQRLREDGALELLRILVPVPGKGEEEPGSGDRDSGSGE